MRRLAALIPIGALAVLIMIFAGWSLHRETHVAPMAMVGKPLPPLVLATLDGGAPVALRSTVKGPMLINVFASWCAPCVQETPALAALKAEGTPIVGIAYKDAPAATADFLTRYGNPYRSVLVDRDGRAGIDLGATGVPETLAVDGAGVIRGKWALPLTAEAAETLLKQAGASSPG